MGWIRATFLEAEMWANRSKPTQVVVNLVNKWFRHVSRWIYIQRPASIFNLSSSSSRAARTTCSRLLLLAALLSTLRCEALLHCWPGHPSTPPHLMFFSTDCRTTPHLNQSSFPLLFVCDSTAASSPSPGRSSLGPHRRPPPYGLGSLAVRGAPPSCVVNVVEEQGDDYTWRGWQ